MSRPSLQHLGLGDLVAAAGGDPWAVDDGVQAGSPAQINFLAQAFHSAAGSSTAAEEAFRTAQQHFEQYNRENGEQPINNSAEVQRVKDGLRASNQQLGQIAADLETIAAALAQARQRCDEQIEALNANLRGYDEYLADYNTHYLAYTLHGDDVDGLIEKCWDGAITDTRTVLSNVTLIRGGYAKVLQSALTNLRVKDGYDPGVVARSFEADRDVPADGVPAAPVPLNPADVESFKVLARDILANDGVPPDQIEARINAAVLQAQQPLSRYVAPESQRRAPLGFGDGFGERWRTTEEAVKNLLGQGGPGAPGVLESWGGLAKGLGDSFLNPVGAGVAQVKDALNAPSPAYFLGEKAFDVSSAAVTLPFGAEGAIVRAGLPAEVLTEGGAPAAVLRGWNPTGGLSWQEFEASFGRPETRVWPENGGFPAGYIPQPAQLTEGTIIDRFGTEWGHYLSPDGTPFADRSLAPESVGSDYNRYIVTGKPLPDGWEIVQGPVEPYYGQAPSPNATQYVITAPDGIRPSVWELVRRGVLDEYGPPFGR
ncbi:TNT domain-containing protein [Mycobacterium sp. P7213]|uniref:TNT domain-containing protein n=1 Tax=Mycobacterium sp. P7213 TaxID=2478465 RepID=UPI000F62D96D|nr:TNT domain-containing protein [Mycobacterium sp. P7213]